MAEVGFCAPHFCGVKCCQACRPSNLTSVLFLHTIKTGGSSVECASRELEKRGVWVNMGHQRRPTDVEACTRACTFRGVRPRIVLSLREPYSYYVSLYQFMYAGAGGASTRLHFEPFMEHYVRTRGYAQSAVIARACGSPCRYDHLLHTETLTADWEALIRATRLPLPRTLPRVNPAVFVRGVPPSIVFSRRVLQIVDDVDDLMFTTFKYARRGLPFNATR